MGLIQATVLLIASVAVANHLTLVAHKICHAINIPGLRLDDWLTS